MAKTTVKKTDIKVNRNKNGKLEKGSVLNPNGRPKGKMMATIIKDFLLEIPEGKTETYAKLIAMSLAKQAMKGDMTAIKEVNDRMDGKATQRQEITGGQGESLFGKEEKEETDSAIRKFLKIK
jgi:hypothetical protein